MAKQMGNSRRGPDDVDRAQRSESGRDPGVEDEGSGALAADSLDDRDTGQVLAEGELVGQWSEDEEDDEALLAGDESVGPWSEDDIDPGMSADSDDDAEEDSEDYLTDMPSPDAGR